MRSTNRGPLLAFLGGSLLAIAVGLYFYDELFDFAALRFATYPHLGKDQVSEQDYHKALTLHAECFEGVKRQKLTAYLLATKYSDSPELMQSMVKKQVDSYIISSRQDKITSFRDTKNVTLVRKGSEVIGLYNCVREDEVTGGSVMIYNVCLQPKWRGRGYGETIMNHAIARCYEKGRDLTLSVYKDHKPAIKLYEKLHFRTYDPPHDPGDDFNFYDKYIMKYVKP